MFNRVVEVLGDQKRQAERGDVVALLHGADGLARNANMLGQGFLGHAFFLAQRAQTVVDSVGCHIRMAAILSGLGESVKRGLQPALRKVVFQRFSSKTTFDS